MSTAVQIRTIHTLKSRAGLDDHDYRALLSRHGVESSKDLVGTAAVKLIAEMRRLPGADRPAPSATRAEGRYAGALQSLWIAAYNLGVVRDKSDKAMMSFVERQTDLSHVRFLTAHADATRAIEALKAWIRREGGVVWPRTVIMADRQRAVCAAIVTRLDGLGSPVPDLETYGHALGLPLTLMLYRDEHWMTLANALGRRLRGAQQRGALKTKGDAK